MGGDERSQPRCNRINYLLISFIHYDFSSNTAHKIKIANDSSIRPFKIALIKVDTVGDYILFRVYRFRRCTIYLFSS